MTAISVFSEIGGDMSVFPTAKHLCSWAGCCPRNDQSGGKMKSTRISRAGTFLKPLPVQVANALIHYKKHPEFSERYHRIKARRGHKKSHYCCVQDAPDCYLEHPVQACALHTRWLSCCPTHSLRLQVSYGVTSLSAFAPSWLCSCG